VTHSAEIIDGWMMYSWAKDLFPIARSITGPGFRESLDMLDNQLSGQIKVHSVPSGTKAFDWTVPDEWVVRDAWIEHESGERILDFKENNLHLVGYSVPVDRLVN
jgi:aminopeptidase-like protein